MIKLVIGLFGLLAVVGTADTNTETSLVWIAIGLLITIPITAVGFFELIGQQRESYLND